MKKAILWEVYDKSKRIIRCNLCHRRCLVPNGYSGICQVRKNIDGVLYASEYGKIVADGIDPIEKKPLFHFFPGSYTYSIAFPSCNFMCSFCCNWEISQMIREKIPLPYFRAKPEDVVRTAIENRTKIISYTYTEPSIHIEFIKDTGTLARKAGLKNVFVTNGYFTPEAVKIMKKFLDAATIDIKGNLNKKFYEKYINVYNPEKILETLLELKKHKIHLEITDLIIPKIGDDVENFRKLVKFIVDNLGDETPLHILQFFPSYKLTNLPRTPIKTLLKHYEIAKQEGLKFVYLGNVPGGKYENTYCPRCGKPVLERKGIFLVKSNIDERGRCKFCGYKLPIIME